jgi:RNA recognition motif-containing protein
VSIGFLKTDFLQRRELEGTLLVQMSENTTICIYNLNTNTTEHDLVNFFNEYISEEINESNIRIVKCLNTGISRGIAYVTFLNRDDFTTALELNNTPLHERMLRISEGVVRTRPIPIPIRKAAKN